MTPLKPGVFEELEGPRLIADGTPDDGDILNVVETETVFHALGDVRRFDRHDPRGLGGGPEGEQADVSADIDDRVGRTELESGPAVGAVPEDLLHDVVGTPELLPRPQGELQAVGERNDDRRGGRNCAGGFHDVETWRLLAEGGAVVPAGLPTLEIGPRVNGMTDSDEFTPTVSRTRGLVQYRPADRRKLSRTGGKDRPIPTQPASSERLKGSTGPRSGPRTYFRR